MKIGKIYRFEAAHHLPGHKGKCACLHGHSYRLEVEVESSELIPEGPSDGGMVLDFADLDSIVKPLIEILDHTDLNVSARSHLDVPRPTAELLCRGIAHRLRSRVSNFNVGLSRVRLWETEKCYAEWTG